MGNNIFEFKFGTDYNNKKEKKLNKKKIVKLVIVIVSIIAVAVLGTLYEKNNNVRVFFDTYIFRKDKYESNLPTIEINSNKASNLYAYNGKIIKLNDNVLSAYNTSGTKEYTLDIEISDPVFEASGKYLCIAEKNGQKIYVVSGRNIIWQNEIEGNIANVTINENGYTAVSILGTSHKTVVSTYDANGTPLFNQYLSFSYVIDSDISPDNKYLAIAEANFSGIEIQSNIKIISMEEETLTYNYASKAGDLIIKIKYQNNNSLYCMYNEHIDIIKDNKNAKVSDFNKEKVLFADLNNNIIKVVQTSSNLLNNKTELQIIKNNKEHIKTYEIKEPKAIVSSGNISAINLGSEILFINNNGWLVKKYISSQEVNKIILSDGIAGIVYSDKIEIVSL